METAAESKAVHDGVMTLEIDLLVEVIQRRFGYDLTPYDPSFVRERIRRRLRAERLSRVSQLLFRILQRPEAWIALLAECSERPSGLFRPVAVWRALRRRVMPLLRTHSSVRVWIPCCSSEEGLYSLAILFEEELRRKFTIYATGVHEDLIDRVRSSTLRPRQLREAQEPYRRAGGRGDLSRYLDRADDRSLPPVLSRGRIVFGSHNLATDASFNTFHLILARNITRGFSDPLRSRAHSVIHESLAPFAFLALGEAEQKDGFREDRGYREIDPDAGVFQKLVT
jgi:chemotaxis protein methyltransferase CheR